MIDALLKIGLAIVWVLAADYLIRVLPYIAH
jgi:hypothetical protein